VILSIRRPGMESVGDHNATFATIEIAISTRPSLWPPMIPLAFEDV
jgi:hypothetical protein